MIRFRSWMCAVALLLLGCGLATGLAPDAQARVCYDPACLHLNLRDAPPVARGQTVTLTFTVSLRDPVRSARFSVSVRKGLDVVDGSAVLDGSLVDGASYTATNVHFGIPRVAAGQHTITLAVHATQAAGAYGTLIATFSYGEPDGGRHGETEVTAVPVQGDDYGLDLQVPNGAPLLARPGSWISFPADIEGSTAKGPATLDVTLPPGLDTGVRVYLLAGNRLGSRLSCRALKAGTAACAVPRHPGSDTEVEVFLPTSVHTDPGTTGTVSFQIVPALQQDPNPKDNFADAQVRFVAATDVSYSFSQTSVYAPVGTTVPLTMTVRNNGSATTPVLTGQFRFTPSLDEPDPPFDVEIDGPGRFGGGGSVPFHAGPLRPGATAVYAVTVTVVRQGVPLVLTAEDDTFSPSPGCFPAGCGPSASVTVTPAARGTGGPPLADTGVSVGEQLAAGLGLVGAGLALALAGRRRRTTTV